MKTILILSAFLVGVGLSSCQSEYSERMATAIELKGKYMEVKDIIDESNNSNLRPMLTEIEEEINLQAKISGNEELFLKQIWKN